jgi:hypothetical protein
MAVVRELEVELSDHDVPLPNDGLNTMPAVKLRAFRIEVRVAAGGDRNLAVRLRRAGRHAQGGAVGAVAVGR